jgi:hypothetical protein
LLIFSDSQNYLELSTHEATATPYVTGIVEGHIVRCHKSGYIPHQLMNISILFANITIVGGFILWDALLALAGIRKLKFV